MNWKQIYISATPKEREELTLLFLRRACAPRARALPYRRLSLFLFLGILATVSAATLLLAVHIPPACAVYLLVSYTAGILLCIYLPPILRAGRGA